MNPETLLNQAAWAIQDRGISIVGGYHVCFLEGKIQCVSTAHPVQQKFVFGTFRGDELQKGLTAKQWDSLSLKIIDFYEKETLKCLGQKH